MPPFDYHPSTTIPAPKVPQPTPSPLQKVYLRNVDTGPDSAKGALFRRTPLEDLPAALPDDAPRAIFTEKLLRHERDTLMPYVHSEKVSGHAIVHEDGSATAAGDNGAKDDSDAEETEQRRKRRKQSIAGESSAPSAGTDVQLDGGAGPSIPASLLESPPSPSSEPLQDGSGSGSGGEYVKTPLPGLVFDANIATTVRSAHLPLTLGLAAVIGVFLLAGFGTWGTARIVDLGVLLLVGAYVVFVAPDTSVASLLTAVRDMYRSNPTLWQSALLALVSVYAVTFLLDMSSLVTFTVLDVGAWIVVVTQIVFLAAKHWAGVDLFDALVPASWFGGGASKEQEEEAKGDAKAEVYHVAQNTYTYGEAAQVCAAMDARLATYDQIEDAYQHGAEWCGYGWSEGQMAFFPTQKKTWSRLQSTAASADQKQACGRPGVNGGFMTNPDMKFGVNCFGVKPAKSSNDVVAAPVPETGGGGVGAGAAKFYPRQDLRLQSFNRTQWSEASAPDDDAKKQ